MILGMRYASYESATIRSALARVVSGTAALRTETDRIPNFWFAGHPLGIQSQHP
jgi:hypothetical protein